MNTEFREGSKQESDEGGGEYEYTQHRPIWYGWSEMQRDLTMIRELAAQARRDHASGKPLAMAKPLAGVTLPDDVPLTSAHSK